MVLLAVRWIKNREKMGKTNPCWASADRQKQKSVKKTAAWAAGEESNTRTSCWHGTQKSNRSTMNNLVYIMDRQEKEKQAPKGSRSLGMNLRGAQPAGEVTRLRQQAVTEIAHKNKNQAETMGMATWDHEKEKNSHTLTLQTGPGNDAPE
jgi:hypothetical protein